MGFGGYLPEELPDRARHLTDLWKYVGECTNGGHAQYLLNTDRCVETYRRVSVLLGDMKQADYQVIFDDFIDIFLENEEAIDVSVKNEGAIDCLQSIRTLFLDLNEKFYRVHDRQDDVTASMRQWLLRQPWIVIDENARDLIGFVDFIPVHPLAEQRGGDIWRARAAMKARARKAHAKRSMLRKLTGIFNFDRS